MAQRRRTPVGWALLALGAVGSYVAFARLGQWLFTAERWEGRIPEGYSVSLPSLWLWILVATAAVVAVHEAGHAVAGALVGFRPFRVIVGTGPTLMRFSLGGTRVELRALPFTGGLTEMATRRPGALWSRHAFAVAGGPLTPLVGAVVLLRWDTPSIDLEIVRILAIGIILYTSLLSLVPYRSGGMHSDGMHLLECIRQRPQTRRQLLAAHDALSLRDAIEGADTDQLSTLRNSSDPVIASVAAVSAEDWDTAITAARAGLQAAHPEQVTALRNNLAFALARREAPGDIDEALSLAELLDPSTDGAAVADTVGLVLLRAGRASDALPHLRRAHQQPDLTHDSRAAVAAHLAEAAYASGDAHLGRRALAAALRHTTSHPELERAFAVALAPETEVIRGFWDSATGDDDARAAELAAALGDGVGATIAVLARASAEDPGLVPLAEALRRRRGNRTGR